MSADTIVALVLGTVAVFSLGVIVGRFLAFVEEGR